MLRAVVKISVLYLEVQSTYCCLIVFLAGKEVEDVGQNLDFYWLEITSPSGLVTGLLWSAVTVAICLLHTASYEKILDSQTKLF